MALNKPDRLELEIEARKRGYEQSSDDSKMINKSTGDWLKISESGGSASTKHRTFTDLYNAKKSKSW